MLYSDFVSRAVMISHARWSFLEIERSDVVEIFQKLSQILNHRQITVGDKSVINRKHKLSSERKRVDWQVPSKNIKTNSSWQHPSIPPQNTFLPFPLFFLHALLRHQKVTRKKRSSTTGDVFSRKCWCRRNSIRHYFITEHQAATSVMAMEEMKAFYRKALWRNKKRLSWKSKFMFQRSFAIFLFLLVVVAHSAIAIARNDENKYVTCWMKEVRSERDNFLIVIAIRKRVIGCREGSKHQLRINSENITRKR